MVIHQYKEYLNFFIWGNLHQCALVEVARPEAYVACLKGIVGSMSKSMVNRASISLLDPIINNMSRNVCCYIFILDVCKGWPKVFSLEKVQEKGFIHILSACAQFVLNKRDFKTK